MFKKYKIINGKKYGPYLYENRRVGEKIITNYLGKSETHEKRNINYSILIIIFLLVILASIFVLMDRLSPTGKVVLDIKTSYGFGEPLDGKADFVLKNGELLPADSIIRFDMGNYSQEFILSEIVDDTKSEGNFYLEDTTLL